MVKVLLAVDADVNKTNDYNKTPLHYASHFGQFEILKSLLLATVDLNNKRKNGRLIREVAKTNEIENLSCITILDIVINH